MNTFSNHFPYGNGLAVAAIFVLTTLFSGCSSSQKLATLKPEPEPTDAPLYAAETSFLSLPVSLALSDIEKQLNLHIQGLIYEDTKIEDDQVRLKVWKEAPIGIKQVQQKIQITLPLRAEGAFQYGFDKLGISFKDIRDFKLNGVVTLLCDIHLTNWKLNTKTTVQSVDWKEPPSVNIGGRAVQVTPIVNSSLKFFRKDIEKTIDQALQNQLNFQPQVLDALQAISKPILLNEAFQTWFQIMPLELYTTDTKIENQRITTKMGLKCTMETRVGQNSNLTFERSKIQLKPVTSLPDKVQAQVVAFSSYKDAAALINQNFKGQVFGDAKRKVTVEQVELWQKNQKLIIALHLKGSLNGAIYLSGVPKYDEGKKEIYLDEMDYVLDTKNVLHKMANSFLQGSILKKIESLCRYSIAKEWSEGQQQLAQYLNKYEPVKGVRVNGNVKDMTFTKIETTPRGVAAFLRVQGQVRVDIDGL